MNKQREEKWHSEKFNLLTLHIVKLTIKKDEVNGMCGTLRESTYIYKLVIGKL